MSKQKSIFVTVIISALLAFVTLAAHKMNTPVFTIIVCVFSGFGFISSAIAFCRWLEMPSENNHAEIFEPVEIAKQEDQYDFSDIIDEVKNNAENKKF